MNESNEVLRILVVDDSTVSRNLAEYVLAGKPYKVFFADGAQQALKLFASHRPDVVITDWMTPELSGLELCRMIRNKLKCRDTYLILLTSNSRNDHIAEGLAAGADGYLTKPLRSEELLGQLRTARGVLKTRRQMETNKSLS
ncbi:MAG TPA: response regulator [Candidatus Acidoferrum sp.]|nr:response regulator [Candidatus Acidoferrum sp.]